MAEKMVKVYGMRAPAISDEIRYVGITTQQMERRLSQHWHRVRGGERTHKATWMRKVQAMGHMVEMVLLDEVPESEWQEAERRYIAQFSNLTNSTAGGEGLLEPTTETRARMRDAQLGKKATPDSIEKRRAAMLGNKHGLGKKHTPEHIAKAVAGRIGKVGVYVRTPESIEKMRAKKLGKQPHLGAKRSEQSRARMKEAALRRWAAVRGAANSGTVDGRE